MSDKSPKKQPKPDGGHVAVLDHPAMTFGDALKEASEGHTVRRTSWMDPSTAVFLIGERLSIRTEDGKTHDLIVTKGDIDGDDWVTADPH